MTLNITITSSAGPDGPHGSLPHQESVNHNINKSGRSGGGTAVLLKREELSIAGRGLPPNGSHLLSHFFWKERRKVSLKNRFLLLLFSRLLGYWRGLWSVPCIVSAVTNGWRSSRTCTWNQHTTFVVGGFYYASAYY
jgi:hypothetical protein